MVISQLYSVRDAVPEDMDGVLRKLSQMGYSFVEFAGFFDYPATEVRRLLDLYGLRAAGAHTALDEISERFAETVAFHKAIGNDFLIIPAHDLSSQDKIDLFVERVNRLQPKLETEGLRLGFHNHQREFLPNADGSVAYPALVQQTALCLELDTYWAYVAGQNPAALMEQLKSRMPLLHIKDGLADGTGRPLGRGTAPVEAVYRKAAALGIAMVVESETLTPDGLTEAQICIDYLRSLV